jgi:hypothetical protein
MEKSKILSDLIYIKTGLYITNKNDCKKLSQLISEKKLGYLSESTLYRYFLHPNSPTKPYKNTLHVLAQFCGFDSWNHFQYYCDTDQLHKNVSFLTSTLNKIISEFISKENFDGLITIFKSIENENYKTKEFVGLFVIKAFEKVNCFDKFIFLHGNNLFVRNILMESLFDPNYRIPGYTNAIENYLYHTSIDSKNYLQDIIFGNTVLYRYYYLRNQLEHQKIGNLLYNSNLLDSEINQIHLFPKSRYYAYKIWFINSENSEISEKNVKYEELINWFINEINSTITIIDLNIIYQTVEEVLDNEGLTELKAQLKNNYLEKLKVMDTTFEEYELYHNANGLLNFI